MTSKQKLARIRNWNKRRISGVQANVNQMAGGEYINPLERGFSTAEIMKLKKVNALLYSLIKNWDTNSRNLGLKPKKKDVKYI